MTRANSQPVDISECAREPVHIPGAIQPFGCLVAFALPTWTIAHVSENAAAVFGRSDAAAMIGAQAETILTPKVIHDLRNTFQAAMISGFAERLSGIDIGPGSESHDVLIHASGALAVAEFVPCEGAEAMRSDPTTLVKTIIDRLRRTTSFQNFLTSAARQIRAVTGFDRVMVYKFLADDSGEVVAEALRSGMTPFMGLRYPASDIPAQARALFERQWLRMIPAVDYMPIPIVPVLSSKGSPLDLSLSTLRQRLTRPSAIPAKYGHLVDFDRVDPARRPAVGPDRLPPRHAAPHLDRDGRSGRALRPSLLDSDRGQAAARRACLYRDRPRGARQAHRRNGP